VLVHQFKDGLPPSLPKYRPLSDGEF
jgi:hypothetical protein